MEEFKISGAQLVDKVKDLINQGNIRRIIVKSKEGKTVFELPLTLGVIGLALSPMLAALGAVASLVAECTIVVERDPDAPAPDAAAEVTE